MPRTALVTGGTRGIGAAISVALKAAGYNVAASYAGNDDAAAKFKAETGIAVYSAPSVKHGTLFYYFDPIDQLSADAQARWAVPQEREAMLAEAQREAEKALDVEWGR